MKTPELIGRLIGIADPNVTYARTGFGRPEYSSTDRFKCILNSNQKQAYYATLESLPVAIYFSPTWLNSKNDDVKKLALEKEAYTVALFEPFGEIAIGPYRSQSQIIKIDPSVTEAEIVRTFTRQILIENADVLKLYDYASYLLVLPQVGDLLASQNPETITELRFSNLPTIYNLAKQKGIKFEGLTFGSKEFLQTAFDPNGPWAKMILSPSVSGPVPIN